MDVEGPMIRVMALHALAYCERLFYLEEVEEIRVADDAVFAGRALHEDLRLTEEETGEWTSLELASERLGLVGKIDALRRRDGSYIPYEHKRGRSRRINKKPVPWPSDRLQLGAYAMLLEEETAEPVTEGRIRYHADKVTVRIKIDGEVRKDVREAVERSKELRRLPERPPVTDNDRLCIKCSLSPVCLPEEDRLAKDPEWKTVRLFPADREEKTIHVTTPGSKISRSGETLKISGLENADRVFPIREVGALVCHGYPQVTTQALHFCTYNEVAVHWLSAGGRYIAGLIPGAGNVHRRLRQYKALSDPDFCLVLARKLTEAKVEGALRFVLRATRGKKRDDEGIGRPLETIRSALKGIANADNLDSLRGHEGMAGRAYFSMLPHLFRDDVPSELIIAGRSRRPPKDRFNALLGFGYALLYQAVLQAVIIVGLEPALGFYHQPRSSAHPLVLDLMELFRAPIWDLSLVGSVNRLQWDPAADFEITGKRVWLSSQGKKKAISLFEKRLQDSWRHPVVKYSMSYSRLIELEVRLLEKEWAGQPGLFAKMRLR